MFPVLVHIVIYLLLLYRTKSLVRVHKHAEHHVDGRGILR